VCFARYSWESATDAHFEDMHSAFPDKLQADSAVHFSKERKVLARITEVTESERRRYFIDEADRIKVRDAVAGLLTKADRSETGRAARLKLDRSAAPELYDHVDAEDLRRMELLLDELCATGWVRLLLTKAKDFAGLVDRNPQLELLDFDALAGWSGFQRREERWNQQLIAHHRRRPRVWRGAQGSRQGIPVRSDAVADIQRAYTHSPGRECFGLLHRRSALAGRAIAILADRAGNLQSPPELARNVEC
jgi:hypothetical protein